MARTEKKFGQVVEPAVGVNNELVASSMNRRNLSINITARKASKISLTTFTAAPSYAVTGLALFPSEIKYQSNLFTQNSLQNNTLIALSTPDPGVSSAMIAIRASTAIVNDGGSLIIADLTTASNSDLISTSPTSYITSAGNIGILLGLPEVNYGGYGLSTEYQDPGTIDFRAVHSGTFKAIGPNLYIAISNNTSTAGTGTASVAFLIDSTSVTNQWNQRSISTSDILAGNERLNSVHAVYSTSANKRCAVIQVTRNELRGATNTVIPLRILVAQKTTGQTAASMGGTIAIWPGTTGDTRGNIPLAMQAFNAMDYTEAKDLFAISHGSITNSIGSASSYSGFASGVVPTIPSNAAPAGFRILTPAATDATPGRFMNGTNEYPAAPTGVSVPSPAFGRYPSVVSLKFSPNGNHLAVMYNRDYSGAGNTNSVAVIYSVNSSGTWDHTYSSGPDVKLRGGSSDSMVWLPDNSGVVIISGDSIYDTARTVQFWVPMTGTINYVHSSSSTQVGVSRYSSGPKINSQFRVASTTAAISATATTSIVDNTPGFVVSMGILSSSTSPGRLFYITSYRAGGSDPKEYLRQIKFIDLTTAPVIGSASSSAPAYVNTIAQDLYLDAGETVQISNIVVEPGEIVYAESDTSDAVDVTAYGVEIS